MTLSPDARQAKLNDFYAYAQSAGSLTCGEIMDRVSDLQLDAEEMDKLLTAVAAVERGE
mgnify:CR=1 FL=1